MDDTISRRSALKGLEDLNIASFYEDNEDSKEVYTGVKAMLKALPSAQPFHNITMNDVLKYIDGMPEDVWQEFTACLECRGWELQRRTAKWCGGEFA